MYSIYDISEHKGEVGSSLAVENLDIIAKNLNLVKFKEFLDNGFSIDLKEVEEELESIDFFEITEMEEIVENLLSLIADSKEIIIISMGVE